MDSFTQCYKGQVRKYSEGGAWVMINCQAQDKGKASFVCTRIFPNRKIHLLKDPGK
jgi:hypothetical protein